jgi:hypothetical protein
MKRITLLCFVLISCFAANAQRMQTGNLTVFSEDGTRFYLELNGERYNDEAMTNVRIEELPNPYYSCKIVFENTKIPTITKKTLDIENMDGQLEDVTYRIKNKRGKRTLQYYSSIPAEQNMRRPANTPVYQYGRPREMYVDRNGVMVTQTVTTQQNNGFGMNVNMGGVNMNMSVPHSGGATTTTTTTTTTQGGGYGQGGYNNNGHNNNGGHHNGNNQGGNWNNNNNNNNGSRPCRNAMGNADFEEARKAIKDGNFDDTRIAIAQQIMMTNCLSSNQISEVLKLINFEDSRLQLAKYAYDYCTDKSNYFKLGSVFNFDSSKAELSEFVKSQR